MAEVGQSGLVKATDAAEAATLRRAANGIAYANAGETQLVEADLDRLVQAVPVAIAGALADKAYYFVPLALAEPRKDGHRGTEDTLVSPIYTAALGDEAICHRNVTLPQRGGQAAHEGVFISVRLLNDRFALAFEFFINVGHAFVDAAGVPDEFAALVWAQAVAEIRGETSQDSWESRTAALADRGRTDEKAKLEFTEAAFSDAIAIYLLSLAVDFDYSELREREYPLLAPVALAERLKLVAKLFPPNKDYEFSIRYRRRA
jgi:hypothetical protein